MAALDRRSFLKALPAAALSKLPGRAANGKPWNFLLLFSDDHAWQAVGAYGRSLVPTPHLDRLAHEGMRFDQCLVTNSICAPSRATFLTGKYSHLNGVRDNSKPFDGSQQTFPKLLQKAGYQTAMIGKWHLESDPTGFDRWEVLPGQGSYYNPDFLYSGGRRRREGYCTDIIADLSLDWLKNGRDPAKPFALMSQHKAPHRNWMPPLHKLWMFDGKTLPEPPSLFDNYEHRAFPAHKQAMEIDRHMGLSYDLKIEFPDGVDPSMTSQTPGKNPELPRMTTAQRRAWNAAYGPITAEFLKANRKGRDLVRWKYQRYMKDYLACVSSLDDNIGRLLTYLDESGLAENTFVIYCSDQGFYLGEHGWFDKRWIYEESLRTPLLIRWPGAVKAGSVDRHLVSNLDLAETILDVAGVAPPSDMQGRSIVPILKGTNPAGWRQSFYYHYYEKGVHDVAPHEGVRTDRYTIAHYYESEEWELFDLHNDPQQMRSVYADASYAPVVKQLKAELQRLRMQYKVTD